MLVGGNADSVSGVSLRALEVEERRMDGIQRSRHLRPGSGGHVAADALEDTRPPSQHLGDSLPSALGQPQHHHAAIRWVLLAQDVPGMHEAVNVTGHGGRGDAELAREFDARHVLLVLDREQHPGVQESEAVYGVHAGQGDGHQVARHDLQGAHQCVVVGRLLHIASVADLTALGGVKAPPREAREHKVDVYVTCRCTPPGERPDADRSGVGNLHSPIAALRRLHGGGTGTIYGMKTTLYLPDDVKRAVELEARRRGVSEAEVVRDVLRTSLMSEPVRPRGGIIAGREPIAERVDELLAEGFGR